MSQQSPNASMTKTRPVIAAKLKGPGPGRYGLPSTFGNSGADKTRKVSPAFSFGATHTGTKERKGLETPGPHYVDPAMSRHGRVAGPASTISGRPRSTKRITTPGPGAYATEGKAPPRQRRSPAYSMGARVKSPRKTEVPSPNNYKVPSALGSTFVAKQRAAPAHSMGVRHNLGSFANDNQKTPGPGTYNVSTSNRRRAAAYSMGSRTEMPTDKTQSPGPGSHTPERVTMHKKRAPAFSMGVKHSEYTTPLIIDVPLD